MPELPEVECVRLGVESLINEKVLAAETNYPALWDKESLEVGHLEGETLQAIERKGKYLRFVFEKVHLLLHLGMSGVLLCNRETRPHTHFWLKTTRGDLLEYSDPRKFGHLHLAPIEESFVRWENLGFDALDRRWTGKALFESVQKSTSSIKALLLDQKKVAGVGNIYASEVCFAAGVHPERKGNELNLEECKLLVKHSKRILKKSIEQRGTTFSDYRLTNGKGGEFQSFLKVFQKEKAPCPVCKKPIQKLVQNNRSTFFCASCQV